MVRSLARHVTADKGPFGGVSRCAPIASSTDFRVQGMVVTAIRGSEKGRS